jgi:putative ATP-dependent endonuclease of OLD family
MKLKEVIIKNFRGYSHETRIRIDAITALIGKNDVGKSTILEALDIFFNQTKIGRHVYRSFPCAAQLFRT